MRISAERLGLSRRVPLLLQDESAECGLACIAMVASFHGRRTDLAALRRRGMHAGRGLSMARLMTLAADLGLRGRALRLEPEELGRLAQPAVLHWDMDHFVVSTSVGRGGLRINDPARGRCRVPWNEVSRRFTGVALELAPAAGFRRADERRRLPVTAVMAAIARGASCRGLGRQLSPLVAMLAAVQLLALVTPVATQFAVDEVAASGDRGLLRGLAAGVVLLAGAGALIDALRGWASLHLTTRIDARLSASTLAHLLELPAQYFHRRHLGDIASRLDSLAPLRAALTESSVSTLVNAAVLAATLGLMLVYSARLTLVSIAGLAAGAALGGAFMPAMRRRSEEGLVHRAREETALLESLRGIDTVKALGLERGRLAIWQDHYVAAVNAGVREGRLAVAQRATGAVVTGLEQAIFLAVGVAGVIEGAITLGVLFAFMSLRGRFATAVSALSALARSYFMLRVHTSRLSDVLLAEPELAGGGEPLPAPLRGELAAENLGYAYAAGEDRVLDGFDCRIAPGELVAVAGPSGAGKTTLLRLLAGLLAPSAGRVLVDGVNLARLDRRAYRERIGIVLQDDRLFQGSIAENICAGLPQTDFAVARRVAGLAGAAADIERLPMGLATQVGDMGGTLSGGQRQRIVLARALAREPAILFLDEATSHLDVATERGVIARLRALGITVISVAHRPDALKLADRVLVVGGRAARRRRAG